MSDSRRAQRVDCDIMLNKVEDGHMNVCRATNISLGGMRIQRLLEPLARGAQMMRLQLELPGNEGPIWVGARKVYEDTEYVGLRFTHISHQHFQRLRRWISETDEGANEIAAKVA